MAQEWRFTYQGIPATGSAVLRVRLLEASSSRDMSLDDETGWYTTLERQVFTGSPLHFAIGFPNTAGEIVDENYVMKIYFSKALLPDAMSDAEFLNEFSIYLASTTSGQADNPVLQPRSTYRLIRNPEWDDYSVEFTFPNLYNGIPDFLHHVRVEHRRGALVLGAEQLVRMRPSNIDSSGDGMPDWWKRLHGLDPYNPAGIHGREGDFDGDGLSNWQEYIADLNPADPDDGGRFPRLTLETLPDRRVRLSYPVAPNRRYRVWHTADFSQWTPLHNEWWWPWGNEERLSITDDAPAASPPPARRFYRLEIDVR